jgi:50S ribosomal protein L16 3-hydroxylase
MILKNFPSTEDFYKDYWGKKPFIVRNYIPTDAIERFIDGDTLAGLALEEEIKSRIIINNEAGNEWQCEHGPFDDDRFGKIGNKNWSVLVQNVEQYHTDTAKILSYFQFSPRWLLDDVMVSFSAPGGSVGPHTDSYHTFLVQGIGKRAWKISADQINDDSYVDNPDMKILRSGFDGETFEVNAGDVIYMPPFFGHEGKTIDAAMTFSVGFLGPQLSEILSEYAQHLEKNEALNKRFLGENIDTNSAHFTIGKETLSIITNNLISSIQSDDFSTAMAAYFSTPTHEIIEDINLHKDKDLLAVLKAGETLSRPEETKLAITQSSNGNFNLAIYGESITVSSAQEGLVNKLNEAQPIAFGDLEACDNQDEAIALITTLYKQNVLSLEADNNT